MIYRKCLIRDAFLPYIGLPSHDKSERDIGVVITIRYSMFFMVSTLWLKLENLSILKN